MSVLDRGTSPKCLHISISDGLFLAVTLFLVVNGHWLKKTPEVVSVDRGKYNLLFVLVW